MRLYNEDCFDVMQRMKSKSVDLILTDFPYDWKDMDIKLPYHEEMVRVCNGTIIMFAPPENQWVGNADQYGFWIKPISTKNTSRRYSRFVEMILFYGSGTWNVDRHWSQYTNVFNDLVDDSSIHPYRKPPSLITRLVKNHSKPNQIIFDPFMGSGVVGEVSLPLNRIFIGCEIDDKVFSNTVQRLDDLRGETA